MPNIEKCMNEKSNENDTNEAFSRDVLLAVLQETINQIDSFGKDFVREKRSIEELKERLTQGRYHLAVLGQFKRGKSTFLNALIGEDILPSSIVPLTSIPTFIRYHSSAMLVIRFNENREEKSFSAVNIQEAKEILSSFVTEDSNPRNKLGVLEAELFYPSDVLSKGVVFIDTPGIGSTFRHNTEATLNFLPQCDAALFLVSHDPPITEVEVDFLKEVKKKISRLFFVLNKNDYLDEQERQTALAFLKRVLREQAGFDTDIDVVCVSARNGLKAKVNHDSALWDISGMESVRSHLIDFCAREKMTALSEAISLKAIDILENITMRFQLMSSSLQMPLEDLEKRLAVFTEKVDEIDQTTIEAKDILKGDKGRMYQRLGKKISILDKQSREYLNRILTETVHIHDNPDINENKLQDALSDVIPGYFEHEFGKMMSFAKKERDQIFEKHQQRIESLIDSIRKTASELFEIPYTNRRLFAPLKIASAPYWVTHSWQASLLMVSPAFIDKFLTRQMRQERILKRLKEQVNDLVIRNMENLRWSLFQTIDKEFRSFSNMLDEQYKETVNVLHGATSAVMKKRKEHTSGIREEAERLQNRSKEIKKILEKINNVFSVFMNQ